MTNGEARLGNYFSSRREKGVAGLPTLSVTLDRGLVRRDSLERRTDTKLAPEEHLRVRPGDIAYNMMRMWQGASGLATEDAIVSPAYVVLAPKANVDPKFAAYLLKLPHMVHLLWAYSYGLTNDRLRLYFNDFKRIPWELPPLPEQKKIAEILSTWDKAIETTEKLLANAEAQKKALMQQLLTGKRRLKGFDGEWTKRMIGDLFDVQLGKMLNKKAKSGSQYRYLTNTNVRWGRFDLSSMNEMHFSEKEKEKFCLRKGDLLVCEGGEVGRCAIWEEQEADCYYQKALHRLRPRTPDISSRYAYFYFNYGSTSGLFKNYSSRSSIAHLTREKLLQIPIQVPSIYEQEKIVEILSDCDGEIENARLQLNALITEKRALMQQLLTGKRRVAA